MLKKHNVNKDDITDMASADVIIEESGMAGGPEQKLRPNQADRILKSYCENLNQKYFDKKIDPVIGREEETENLKQIQKIPLIQMIQIILLIQMIQIIPLIQVIQIIPSNPEEV